MLARILSSVTFLLLLCGCNPVVQYHDTTRVGKLVSLKNLSTSSQEGSISGVMGLSFGVVEGKTRTTQEVYYVFYCQNDSGIVKFHKLPADKVSFRFGDSLDVHLVKQGYYKKNWYSHPSPDEYIITIPEDKFDKYISVNLGNF